MKELLTAALRPGGSFALLAWAAVGCSNDPRPSARGEVSGSLLLALRTTEGVVITSVSYDLDTQGGTSVASGEVPVPNDDSEISLGFEGLPAPAGYRLTFSATGSYRGRDVPCASEPSDFNLAPREDLELAPIDLVCVLEVPVGDTTGGIFTSVEAVAEQIIVDGVEETFTYGPRSVRAVRHGDACVYPPVELEVFGSDPSVERTWLAAPDGTLLVNTTGTRGTYTCTSRGTKALTLTLTRGGIVSSKSVTLECDSLSCDVDCTCGDGIVGCGEECDENTPRCTNCVITPTCGDGVVDGPNGLCAGLVEKPVCNEVCDDSGPSEACSASCECLACEAP
jgi:hypothetical protein